MFRHLTFSFIICCLLTTAVFSQIPNSQSESDKSIEALLATAVEDFTRGFIEGFDNSIEAQIVAFEFQTNDRKDLSKNQKIATNTQFRKSFSEAMGRVRNRVLDELKIAEMFKLRMVEYYKTNYSEEELFKLSEFMRTPLGKKVLQNQTKYAQFINDFSKSLTLDERFLKIVNEESKKMSSAKVFPN